MPRSYNHLSPFSPLRYAVGLGWRGYRLYGDLRHYLPAKAVDQLDQLGDKVHGRLKDVGLTGTARTRRAEAVLTIIYQELQRLEDLIDPETKMEKAYAQIVRNSVVDWELILLPERHAIFELFGVERRDPFSVIKFRYRQLARLLHPDKPYGNGERMSEVNDAYEILSRMLGVR